MFGSVGNDNKGVVNQASIEAYVWKAHQDQFFMEAVVDGGIHACAARSHGGAIGLSEEATSKREDVVGHQKRNAIQNKRGREVWWKLIAMQIEPLSENANGMFCIDVCIH